MAKTSTASVSYALSGDGFTGSPPLWAQAIVNVSSNPPSSWTLANGFNQFAVPATATSALVVFPPGSTVSKTIKGANGDTGQAVGPTGFYLLTFAAGTVPNLGLAANGAETVSIFWG